MFDKRAIGVFDSGLGGLTVVKELSRYMPSEDIIYFGDTGRVPYGTRSNEIIRRYAREDAEFLLKNNVKLIIAACGTVSSVASDIGDNLGVPFFEVVSHSAKSACNITKNGKIGVLGTSATIRSQKHAEYIKSILPNAQIVSNSCTVFVPLVEEGWYADDDPIVVETAKRYLKPITDAECDTVILGCTHYPVLKGAIKSVVGDNVTLIEAGTATAIAVKEFLKENSMENESCNVGKHSYFVSDRPNSFKNIASVLLGKKIDDDEIKQVDISKL